MSNKMKIGPAAWGFRETPLEKQLEITKNLGFSYLELGIAGHENDFLHPDNLKHIIDDLNLIINIVETL